MSGEPSNSPWPGQCPDGVSSTCIGCLPQARQPSMDDVMPIWQVDESPQNRGMQVRQFLNSFGIGVTFNPDDFFDNDQGTISLAGTIQTAHSWTEAQTFESNVTIDGLLNAGTIVPTTKMNVANLPTSDAGLSQGDVYLSGTILCAKS